MRVISGLAKGKKLKAPAGLATRPITDMIKEALFNVLGSRIPESNLLDLFAGSGSVGIEALSRGARSVIFVDNSHEAVKIIKENLNNCNLTSEYQILRMDVFKAIGLLERHNHKFDVIYIDPPFTNEKIFHEVLKVLDEVDILKPDGIAVIRTPRRKEMPMGKRMCHYRLNHYGESSLYYYCWSKEEPKDDGNFSHIG